MAEYIEREALLKHIEIHCGCCGEARHCIGEAPAADVVEVVRCKECRFYETDVEYYGGGTKDVCRLLKRQMQCDDFCSYGERRGT